MTDGCMFMNYNTETFRNEALKKINTNTLLKADMTQNDDCDHVSSQMRKTSIKEFTIINSGAAV